MTNEKDEVLFPIEHNKYKGYFYVPKYSNVLVNKNGLFINSNTGILLKSYITVKGYVTLPKDITNEIQNRLVHRLIALTFIGRPARHKNTPFEHLQVNHLDGNKINNNLSNLEWCTNQENVRHAVDNGLMPACPVLAKNIQTNEIKRFVSTAACGDYFNINQTKLRNHIDSPQYGTITKDWFVFKKDDNTPWPILENKHNFQNNWEPVKIAWYFKNINTNSVLIFKTLEDAANEFKCYAPSLNALKKADNNNNRIFNNWLFNYGNCPTDEDVLNFKNSLTNIASFRNNVTITDLNTGVINTYKKLSVACNDLNLNRRKIEYALKHFNGISDNYKIERPFNIVTEKSLISSEKRKQAGLNKVISDETKEKLRQVNLGKIQSPEAVERNRQSNLGHTVSDETRKKISIGNTGKVRIPKTIELH